MRTTAHQIEPRRARLLTLLSAVRHHYGNDHAGLLAAIEHVVGSLNTNERIALVSRLVHEIEAYE